MANKKDIEAKLKTLGILYDPKATVKVLTALLKAKTSSVAQTKKGNKIYFVYVDSYVSDEDILPRGVYRCSKKIERLEISKARFVESFDEGDVPEDKIHEIAKVLKVSVKTEDGKEFRKKEDILEELVEDLEIK